VDVSLLSIEHESNDAERSFFDANPSAGQFHLWCGISLEKRSCCFRPFAGSLLDPNKFSEEERKIIALYLDPHTIDGVWARRLHLLADDRCSYEIADLPKKVPELRRMLYTSYNKSAIIMVHCEAGELTSQLPSRWDGDLIIA
jgi:hypothetical protein